MKSGYELREETKKKIGAEYSKWSLPDCMVKNNVDDDAKRRESERNVPKLEPRHRDKHLKPFILEELIEFGKQLRLEHTSQMTALQRPNEKTDEQLLWPIQKAYDHANRLRQKANTDLELKDLKVIEKAVRDVYRDSWPTPKYEEVSRAFAKALRDAPLQLLDPKDAKTFMAAYAYREWPGKAFPFAVAFRELLSIKVAFSPEGQAMITQRNADGLAPSKTYLRVGDANP
jgi:hypothetical protein